MFYVYSTMSAGVDYAFYSQDAKIVERVVTIKGGTGVMNKNLITPKGVMTEITDEEYELLMTHYLFNLHVSEGFITVQMKEARKIEDVVKDMKSRDESAQLTNADYDKGGRLYKPKEAVALTD